MRENLAAALRLLLVTDDQLVAGRDLVSLCRGAVEGGVSSVQLRLKTMPDRDLLALARALREALTVPLFINDRVDIALASGADGVHLGPDDLAPALARAIVPPGFVIGASVGEESEIERGIAADYWGIGPLHSTSTKQDAGAALGFERATALVRRAGTRPCVLIGGVTPEDVVASRAAGFSGVAVVRGILGQSDVRAAALRYSEV